MSSLVQVGPFTAAERRRAVCPARTGKSGRRLTPMRGDGYAPPSRARLPLFRPWGGVPRGLRHAVRPSLTPHVRPLNPRTTVIGTGSSSVGFVLTVSTERPNGRYGPRARTRVAKRPPADRFDYGRSSSKMFMRSALDPKGRSYVVRRCRAYVFNRFVRAGGNSIFVEFRRLYARGFVLTRCLRAVVRPF